MSEKPKVPSDSVIVMNLMDNMQARLTRPEGATAAQLHADTLEYSDLLWSWGFPSERGISERKADAHYRVLASMAYMEAVGGLAREDLLIGVRITNVPH
jgi:hypothetical protein